MSQTLDTIALSRATDFIKSEFYIQNEKSKLKLYSFEDWKKFCLV